MDLVGTRIWTIPFSIQIWLANLIHLQGDHTSDFSAYSALTDHYRVLSFDFRGHGGSSHTKPYSFHQIVEDIEALRRHFAGDEQCVVCGGSFGGFIAQEYAIQYPTKISHLILRGTAPSHHRKTQHKRQSSSEAWWADSPSDEDGAIKTLERRLQKAPGLSVEMLTGKIFGVFDSDLEFRLIMHAAAPLYSENFDPNAALRKNIETGFNAESHSKSLNNHRLRQTRR